MLIRILEEQDLQVVSKLPREVKEIIKENVQVLVEEYGEERTEKDLGGYIAVVDKKGLKNTIPEYIDEIEGADYISALFLCGSDFSVVVICNKKLINIVEG